MSSGFTNTPPWLLTSWVLSTGEIIHSFAFNRCLNNGSLFHPPSDISSLKPRCTRLLWGPLVVEGSLTLIATIVQGISELGDDFCSLMLGA
jgi:hypothetical protein